MYSYAAVQAKRQYLLTLRVRRLPFDIAEQYGTAYYTKRLIQSPRLYTGHRPIYAIRPEALSLY